MMIKKWHLDFLPQSKYIFFTGKGGVGKTSIASAMAVALADQGKQVMLVSTDPASNLQDVFDTPLDNKGVALAHLPNLVVANFEPEAAALAYKEAALAPYRGKLPEAVLMSMAEQMSGSCTVEVAAFNEFTHFLTDPQVAHQYDHILFDTAPTGHTLRMLELPSAWTSFMDANQHGASCLGQLSGLEQKKEVYRQAVDTLKNEGLTTLCLVTRPEKSAIHEAHRAAVELEAIGIHNHFLIVNGVLEPADDPLSKDMLKRQDEALGMLHKYFATDKCYQISLKAFSVMGLNHLRALFLEDEENAPVQTNALPDVKALDSLVEDLYASNKKLIFTMGKGGVGKTQIATLVAQGLVERGARVHLTTTDPAGSFKRHLKENNLLTTSHIDEKSVLAQYRKEVLDEATESMSEDDLAYLEEDLASPCTQEIAVFRAFADLVHRSEQEIVVVDTAPTGHTLLLLDATESYHKEVERSKGQVPESVKNLLPYLRNESHTEIIIVTLAEATPVHEAKRLKKDLERAGLKNTWWVINQSLSRLKTSNPILQIKGQEEITWIKEVHALTGGQTVLEDWHANESN